MKKTKLLYLDTEATGLYPNKHALTQIAAIVVIDGEELERINLDIDPYTYKDDVEISDKALEITGKTREQISCYPDAKEQLSKLESMLSKYINYYDKDDVFQIIGYNTSFDTAFLKILFKNCEARYGAYFTYRDIDILALVRHLQLWGRIQTKDAKLSTLCKHYNIPLDAHDAMNDIVATRELYQIITMHTVFSRAMNKGDML